MKTTKRFDNGVRKLYTAFHNNELVTMDCTKCAVRNICDNRSDWRYVKEYGMAEHIGYYDVSPNQVIKESGYSLLELMNIESLFMYGRKKEDNYGGWIGDKETKERQFKGLCAVVEYLCELDNIPNVMDYTSLFEYKDKIKELAL